MIRTYAAWLVLVAGVYTTAPGLGAPSRVSQTRADAEPLVIPADWRSRAPFAQRFPSNEGSPHPHIDLAAIRFATGPLVVQLGAGHRAFERPQQGTFAPQLVRDPFIEQSTELFVVQAPDPAEQPGLRAELENMGASIRAYLPDHAYLVWLDQQQHLELTSSPRVFWMGLLQPAWRVAPKLDYVIESDPDRLVQVTAIFDKGRFASASELRLALGRLGVTVVSVAERARDWKVRLRGSAISTRDIVVTPGCLWIERFVDYALDNNVARTSSTTATGRGASAGPLMDIEDVWARGLRGEGQIAAAADTGLSTGDLATLHHDFGQQNLTINPSRVIAGYALGRATWDDDQSIPGAGHGTHVAGSLVGNGVRSGSDPFNNDFPVSSYAGTAPKAGFVFQSIMDAGGSLGGIPTDLNTLFQQAYDDGARVHANSWGSPVGGVYTSDSQEVDQFVWNHPDMLITYTAGNRGVDGSMVSGSFCLSNAMPIDGVIDTDSIGAPGTAKNNITVGASENYRPDFVFEAPQNDCTSSDGIEQKTWGWFGSCQFSTEPVFSDLMADNANGLGAFSSRGPTDDGRIKPDLVAPGIAVISTRTDQNQTYQQWGGCNVPAALQPYYITQGGTSMANPLLAGAAVLARQYYADGWHGDGNSHTNLFAVAADAFNPSAALIKATLINGAWDMTPGQYGAGASQEIPPGWDAGRDLPNNAAGFGRLDLEAALFPGSGFGRDPGRDMQVHDVSPGLTTGVSDSYSIAVASNSDALTVTLVWTDPYAAPAAGTQLVNDLDLIVTDPSATRYYANGIDRTAGSDDRLNNVEQVKVMAPMAGNWTVMVDGFSIPGNGESGTTTQPYALVVSGVLAPPCAVPAAPTGLTATPIGTNRIDLTWNAVPTDSYSIHRATSPGGPYQRIATGITATSHSDTTVSGEVTYHYVVTAINDPNCESDLSNEASSTAFGDCTVAPAFDGLTSASVPSSGDACVVRLDWSEGATACSDPLVYNVYRSTTPGFIPGAANLLQSCVTRPFYDDPTAVSGTDYQYVVRAEDAAIGAAGLCRGGNEDLNVVERAGVVGANATTIAFADDFDGNQTPGDLWDFGFPADNPYTSGSCAPPPTGSGPPIYNNDWYRVETGFCDGNAAASNDMMDPPAYTIDNNGSLVLGLAPSAGPPFTDGGIELPAVVTSITLSFTHDYDFDQTSQSWDGGRVRISVDDWPNFVDIAPVGGYPGTVTSSTFFCTAFPGVDAYVGDSGGCVSATFDLTSYAGSRIWLAWNHGGDDFATADQGWVIDDVLIEATLPDPCSVPPDPVQFLTATAEDGRNVIEWLNPAGGYGSTRIRWSTAGYPTDPNDGVLLVDQNGGAGAVDQTAHTMLTNGTTYYYSAFVDNGSGVFSARRTIAAQPFATTGPAQWAFSSGASALTQPALGSVFVTGNNRVLHATEFADGSWPAGWAPVINNGSIVSPPLVMPIALGGATEVAFVGSLNGRVYALDADTGLQIWASPDLGGEIRGTPAGIFTAFGNAHDLILVGTRDPGALYGLNLADGTVAWMFNNSIAQGGDGLAMGAIVSAAIVDPAANQLWVSSRQQSGGSADSVWSLSFTDTTVSKVWSRGLGDVDASPAREGSTLYVGTTGGLVHALDVMNGADSWAAPFDTADGPLKGAPVARNTGGGQLVIVSTTSTVWSLLDQGNSVALDWSHTAIPAPSAPTVSAVFAHVWVGGGDGALHLLELADGMEIGSVALAPSAIGQPTLDSGNNRVYVATDDGRLFAVDQQSPIPVELLYFKVQ